MPGVNKYSISVTNRFALGSAGEDSSSDEETAQNANANVDPYNMIRKAEQETIKATKNEIKQAERAAKTAKVNPVVEEKKEAKDNKPVERQGNNRRREPKGNQQQRRGPRNERARDNNRDKQGEGFEQRQIAQGEDGQQGDRRRGKPKRQFDRKTANPKSGVRGGEKREGGGAYNWGKADEQPQAEEKPEEQTPEEVTDPENAAADAENEEDENKEPEVAEISLDEYFAQLNATKPAAESKNIRKANDGEELSGKAFRSKKVFTANQPQAIIQERKNEKTVIAPSQLGLISGARNGYRYGNDGRRNDRRGNDNYRNNDRKQGGNRSFTIKKEEFPTLGK